MPHESVTRPTAFHTSPARPLQAGASTYEEELAWSRRYQQEYHQFEASQIAAGVALDDSHFYEAFFKGRPEIASDPGLADDMYVSGDHASLLDILPLTLVGSGIGMRLAIAFPEKRSPKA